MAINLFFKICQCPICQARFAEWLQTGTTAIVWEKYGGVGAGIRKAICPQCYSSDRERLVYLYFKDVFFVKNKKKPVKILHIAPEVNLSIFLMQHPFVEYIAADKRCDGYEYPNYVRDIDIMDMHDIADNTFDVIVCNHVLEHVPDDIVAMKELRRIMKSDGIAVLQVPFALKLKKTFEDRSIVSSKKRFEAYGQSDHLRLYGTDYPQRLQQAGFVVETLDLASRYSHKYGLNKKELLHVCHKR